MNRKGANEKACLNTELTLEYLARKERCNQEGRQHSLQNLISWLHILSFPSLIVDFAIHIWDASLENFFPTSVETDKQILCSEGYGLLLESSVTFLMLCWTQTLCWSSSCSRRARSSSSAFRSISLSAISLVLQPGPTPLKHIRNYTVMSRRQAKMAWCAHEQTFSIDVVLYCWYSWYS